MADEDTETDAIAALALELGKHQRIDQGEQFTVLVPDGATVEFYDSERFQGEPDRSRGTVSVHDAAGFVAAIGQRVGTSEDFAPGVYADEESTALVAVLNDDTLGGPGWRDHRVELSLRRTPEWAHWLKHDGQMLDQEAFAEHIEDGLAELVSPSSATMLDLAQTFHATTSGRFKGGNRLSDGRRQFVYEEEIDATAGTAGGIVIPEELELAVRPFFGAERYAITARFRFRLNTGKLSLGYVLNRPHEMERAAFGAVRDEVAAELGVTIISGIAPGATATRAVR